MQFSFTKILLAKWENARIIAPLKFRSKREEWIMASRVFDLIAREELRQKNNIELIAS